MDPHAGEMTLVKGWQGLHFDRADFRAAILSALESGSTELHYTKLAAEPVAPDFDAIHRELEREPADAYYTDDGTFNVVDEIVGCKFDVDEAQRLWDVAAPGETVTVPLDIVWPEVTGEQLRGQLYHDLLGACMTKFPNSAENRRSNLNLCASRINGFVLYPGETFSYNEIVGERNGNNLRVKWRSRMPGGIGLGHYLAPFLGGVHVEGEYAVSIFLDDVALKPFCQRLSPWVFLIEFADAVEDLGNCYGRYKEVIAVEMTLKPRYHCWIWLLFSQLA